MKPRILIAEDDLTLRSGLQQTLTRHGYAVDVVADGEAALAALCRGGYAAAVLDLGLPLQDGLDVLRTARERGVNTPVLILTARDQPEDRVLGLDCGADDYLIKPFHLAELLARLRALLRRSDAQDSGQLRVGPLLMDIAARQIVFGEQAVMLTPSEFDLLLYLARKAPAVLTREQLEAALRGSDRGSGSNSLDVHIHRLRRKLCRELIRTVHGIGYCLEPGG